MLLGVVIIVVIVIVIFVVVVVVVVVVLNIGVDVERKLSILRIINAQDVSAVGMKPTYLEPMPMRKYSSFKSNGGGKNSMMLCSSPIPKL